MLPTLSPAHTGAVQGGRGPPRASFISAVLHLPWGSMATRTDNDGKKNLQCCNAGVKGLTQLTDDPGLANDVHE